MGKKKKPARDLTTEEALKRLFPKPVRDKLEKEAKEARKRESGSTGKSST